MVKTSDLIAGATDFTTRNGDKLKLRSLSLEDIQRGVEQIQEELSRKNSPVNTILTKTITSGKDMQNSDAISMMIAVLPIALKLTDMFGAACGKDGKWLKRQPLSDLMIIIKKVTELTRPEETLPLFFGLFRTWKGVFKAMKEEPEA